MCEISLMDIISTNAISTILEINSKFTIIKKKKSYLASIVLAFPCSYVETLGAISRCSYQQLFDVREYNESI